MSAPTFWAARPTRFAGLAPAAARRAMALAAVLVAASWLALLAPAPPPVSRDPAARADDEADVVLYETIVARVRGGDDYYLAAADQLRRGDYPLRPFVTFRLPTLAVAEAAMPPWAAVGLLWTLVAGVVFAWWRRLAPALGRRPPRLVAVALLAGGLTAFVQRDLVFFHEIWSGLLVALSLAARRRGRWVEAAAVGLTAVLIRETAALYVAVMAAAAWLEGERREAAGWAAVLGVLAVAVGLHALAVARVVLPSDPASAGWAGMHGFGFFVRTMTLCTALAALPLPLAAPLVALALLGWAAWRDPLAARAAATFAAYAVLLSLCGRADTFYWGLMVAPTLLVGLAFAPDGLRDLWRAAAGRRRITVTRIARGPAR